MTAPEATNIQGFTAQVAGPCGACHIPHNALDKTLWARNLPDGNKSARPYCTGCHSQNGPAKEKRAGENDHPVDVVSKGPQIPPSASVSGLLPLFNPEGGRENGDIIRCRTCHDPHIWSSGNPKTAMPARPSPAEGSAVKNIEGNAKTSFLRKPASPSPDLCVVCHEDTALLTGTDHDLFVTAPAATNQQGQTVAESGPCGACHAAHHSDKKHLLWARAYGPSGEHQHPMNGLCTGCHSKGQIAEKKIPAVAEHPPGQLMNNIMRSHALPANHIKLFDSGWKESHVGDLSCSSCHSFFMWDHRVRQKGPGKNTEGNADTSFLRTSSDKAVCIDCHGETAIWRYTYFHSPAKREMLEGRRPE